MKVLLLARDLYHNIGGGQTVYRKIIEASPSIDFYYFRHNEPRANPDRPVNAKPMDLNLRHAPGAPKSPPLISSAIKNCVARLERYASSVSGMDFDIIESPDYEPFGALAPKIFSFHGVGFRRTMLSLHGNISTSVRLNWNPHDVRELEYLEYEQFRLADGVYGISPAYMREWRARLDREVSYVNPLHFVRRPRRLPPYDPSASDKPALCCPGRLEKCKGNDVFVELLRWLPRELYAEALHAGEDQPAYGEMPASALFRDMALTRGLTGVRHVGLLNWPELTGLFARKALAIIPARYDTLNLIALEALFHGCPAAVSNRAGVCAFLDEELPGLPYLKIDFDNLYGCVDGVADMLRNYDARRAELADRLQRLPDNIPELNMAALYRKTLTGPSQDKSVLAVINTGMEQRRAAAKRWGAPHDLARTICRAVRNCARRLRAVKMALPKPMADALRNRCRFIRSLYALPRQEARMWSVNYPSRALDDRLTHLAAIYRKSPFFRGLVLREIASLENMLDNRPAAAAYFLRLLRMSSGDRFKLAPACAGLLERIGFGEVAEAVRAMHPAAGEASQSVYGYLAARRENNRRKPDLPYETVEDWRGAGPPRVSVIVSLYNAASKLEFFLTALGNQTLLKKGEAEIIFQDSASPDRERQVLEDFRRRRPLNAAYGRSRSRETIQCAWNRGIKLARAPYLVFLGVDEGLYPDALETLADELDRNVSVDWVMADSLVMEVDDRGAPAKDVMTYRRAGGTGDHAYLETCYLSWVGGMYRKSLHDRFGYYDETFRAAGDTEFKNRILPGINVKFLPGVLGLFFNYPGERTTASPAAEIEDARAWYMHRTLGGVRYAFENRPIEDVKRQLLRSLGYRKSYCGHLSSDFDYGLALARHGIERTGDAWWREMAADLEQLQGALEVFEYGEPPGRLGRFKALSLWRLASALQAKHRRMFGDAARPSYGLFNDNRHEQHSWLWNRD